MKHMKDGQQRPPRPWAALGQAAQPGCPALDRLQRTGCALTSPATYSRPRPAARPSWHQFLFL